MVVTDQNNVAFATTTTKAKSVLGVDDILKEIETLKKQLNEMPFEIFNKDNPVGTVRMLFKYQSPPYHGVNNVTWEQLPKGYAIVTTDVWAKDLMQLTEGQRLDNVETEGHELTLDELPKYKRQLVWPYSTSNFGNAGTGQKGWHSTREDQFVEFGNDKSHKHGLKIKTIKLILWKRIA